MFKFIFTFLFLFGVCATPLLAQDEPPEIYEETQEFQSFETEYTVIYYTHEDDLKEFFWRLSGDEDIDFYTYPGFAQSRVDRIVEKVQAVLDMYPEGFRVKIYLYPEYDRGPIAYYSYKGKSITTYADTVTEGVLAHEIAHGVVRSYFRVLPPRKIREMLSQYVDKHLWSE